jgi:Flp pilus assembly protein TadG
MKSRGLFQRLRDNKKGATIAEFAAIIGPLLFFIMGALDVAWQAYASSVFQGTLQKIARLGSLENATNSQINSVAQNDLKVFASSANISVATKSFKSFGGIGQPEKITDDKAPVGTYNSTDCYIDANGNGSYDTSQGTVGLGTADDIVEYTMTMSLKRLSPVSGVIGLQDPVVISRKTVLRVEPYAGTTPPVVRCS